MNYRKKLRVFSSLSGTPHPGPPVLPHRGPSHCNHHPPRSPGHRAVTRKPRGGGPGHHLEQCVSGPGHLHSRESDTACHAAFQTHPREINSGNAKSHGDCWDPPTWPVMEFTDLLSGRTKSALAASPPRKGRPAPARQLISGADAGCRTAGPQRVLKSTGPRGPETRGGPRLWAFPGLTPTLPGGGGLICFLMEALSET